ncbi:MAG: MBL fold metallo-hydrolase [Rhizobiales bacterium PAR1]|nr:MAG: MBL fold metallo-hydrolase [Rhizobiales bacterium PAR1]
MDVRIWGARGSYPASGARFSGFGHHTACVSVSSGSDLFVLDAGSGAAELAAALENPSLKHVHVILSHFHHDHIMGLPFLLFGLGEGVAVTIHSALGADVALGTIVTALFSPPYFPSDAARLLARIRFQAHAEGASFDAGTFAVRTTPVEHPGGAAAFRLEKDGKSLVYATDLETSTIPPAGLVALTQGADLLLHDTMFSAAEAQAHRGWGHSTLEAAAALAITAGVGRLVGFHHNPRHDDAELVAREAIFAGLYPGASLAREGQLIAL